MSRENDISTLHGATVFLLGGPEGMSLGERMLIRRAVDDYTKTFEKNTGRRVNWQQGRVVVAGLKIYGFHSDNDDYGRGACIAVADSLKNKGHTRGAELLKIKILNSRKK